MLIDEAAFGNPVDVPATADIIDAGKKRFPARKEVFGELVSHFVVFCISITYLFPHGHLMSKSLN